MKSASEANARQTLEHFNANLSVPTSRPVPSPCISVCRMQDPPYMDAAYCVACYRTLTEISRWSVMQDDEKLNVWRQLETRRVACETN